MHIHSFILVRPLTETKLKEGSDPRSFQEQSLFEEDVQAQSIFNRLHSYGQPEPTTEQPKRGGFPSSEIPTARSSVASAGWGNGIPDELQDEWDKFWHRLIYEFWAYKPFVDNPYASAGGLWTKVGGYRVGLGGYIHIGDEKFYYEIGVRNTTMWDIAIFAISLAIPASVGWVGLVLTGNLVGFLITQAVEKFADFLVDDEKASAIFGRLSTAWGSGPIFTSKLGDELSNGWKTTGSALSQGWKDAGGNFSDSAKRAGGAISQGWKGAGGAVSSGWKRAGGSLSKVWKNATGGIKL